MTIRVQYDNSIHDIVLADTLQRLIDSGKIRKFYRYSEKRWITIGVDPVRRQTELVANYSGGERRASQIFETPLLQQVVA
jgi:hypothetical protein